MNKFIAAIIAATASAQDSQDWQKLEIQVGDANMDVYGQSRSWSWAFFDKEYLQIWGNNSISLHTQKSLEDGTALKQTLMGSSIEYDVDVKDVHSGCVAGIYLVESDNGRCSPNVSQGNGLPQCRTIDVMQANKYGFESKAHPCSNGTCDALSQCIIGMQDEAMQIHGSNAYGPGGSKIDTDVRFHVKTEFVSTSDYEKFWKLRTTLSQNGIDIVMEKDCGDYLVGLNNPIAQGMSVVFSSWQDATRNEGFELDRSQNVSETCDESTSWISNFTINRYDAKEDPSDGDGDGGDDGELIIGRVADSIDMCIEEDCTACNMATYSNAADREFPVCTDFTSYKYSNRCGRRQDSSRCGENDDCFRSWPNADKKKWKSDDFACRPLPMRLIEGEFTFARRECRNMRKGQCIFGCEGTCHNSWPVDDPLRWKSADAMCRCKN